MEKGKIKEIAVYPALKREITGPVTEIINWFRAKCIAVCMPVEAAGFFKLKEFAASSQAITKRAEMVLSLGGDGTFLRAARFVCGRDIGILGVNLGSKGFLTEVTLDDRDEYFTALIDGNYTVENRIMLDCGILRGGPAPGGAGRGKKVFAGTALNDVVMSKGAYEHLLKIKTRINGNYAASFLADGLIVSTPTGSTAYSLSAGGPIISSAANCFSITAICPHTLSARPLVISADEAVYITEENAKKVNVVIDGQITFSCAKNDEIIIKKSEKTTRVIRIKKDFYGIVREKLRWVE